MNENKPMTAPGEADRRSYFRIDDHVRLSLRRVPASELAQRIDRLEHDLAGNFTVMSSLAAITSQMSVGLRRIENRDPDLAAYLRAIDHKIEVIGRAFLAQEPECESGPALAVNLSAGGMRVAVDEPMSAGEHVEVRMLLFPSFTGVLVYGDVVDCEPLPPDEAQVGFTHLARISFTHIREQERELLIRHLLRRQSDLLREQNET